MKFWTNRIPTNSNGDFSKLIEKIAGNRQQVKTAAVKEADVTEPANTDDVEVRTDVHSLEGLEHDQNGEPEGENEKKVVNPPSLKASAEEPVKEAQVAAPAVRPQPRVAPAAPARPAAARPAVPGAKPGVPAIPGAKPNIPGKSAVPGVPGAKPVAPAVPGAPSAKPAVAAPTAPGVAKPGVPGAVKPSVPGTANVAAPGAVRPAVPGAKPGVPGAVRPAVPGAKPGVPGARPAVPGGQPVLPKTPALAEADGQTKVADAPALGKGEGDSGENLDGVTKGRFPEPDREEMYKQEPEDDGTAKTDKESEVKDRFTRIANLTPKAKGWLKRYWGMLYPSDYADAMTQDK